MESKTQTDMRKVWMVADNVVSPLGMSTAENYDQIRKGKTGFTSEGVKALSEVPVCLARMSSLPPMAAGATRFETLALHALKGLSEQTGWPEKRTLFIVSTTKGNIELLEDGQPDHPRLSLHAAAQFLADQAGLPDPIVISNACISGVSALIIAKRFLESGHADHAVVLGADVLSRFVVSGFQSLQAISSEPCKPFDRARKGTNLGEAAAAILVSAVPDRFGKKNYIAISGGAMSNDANHISGPSRTGQELANAIQQALDDAGTSTDAIDFISAHGTATVYNDEMEAKAFNLMSLQSVPTQSLKGYFGHTLGAAGVLETALTAMSMQCQEQIPTKGFDTLGVDPPIQVLSTVQSNAMKKALKTASGFGGCNAALVLDQGN